MYTVVPTGALPTRSDVSGPQLRIYEAALELFGERGYDAVSVRDVMASLGQQSGALYAHVASKQDLLCSLIRIGVEEHRDRLREALLEVGPAPADQLRALTFTHVRLHLQYPALSRVATRETRALSAEQRASLAVFSADADQMFVDVINRGVRIGDFTTAHPGMAFKAISAMGILVVEWWTPNSPETATEVAETYADFAVKLVT